MIKILEFLLHGCWHKWEYFGKIKIVDVGDQTVGHNVVYKCKKCEHLKRKRLV